MFLISAVAIGSFYMAGLMWGKGTHLSVVEYWRWWVVHLWVEGFFEVFATAVIAYLFAKLHLVKIIDKDVTQLLESQRARCWKNQPNHYIRSRGMSTELARSPHCILSSRWPRRLHLTDLVALTFISRSFVALIASSRHPHRLHYCLHSSHSSYCLHSSHSSYRPHRLHVTHLVVFGRAKDIVTTGVSTDIGACADQWLEDCRVRN